MLHSRALVLIQKSRVSMRRRNIHQYFIRAGVQTVAPCAQMHLAQAILVQHKFKDASSQSSRNRQFGPGANTKKWESSIRSHQRAPMDNYGVMMMTAPVHLAACWGVVLKALAGLDCINMRLACFFPIWGPLLGICFLALLFRRA